MNSNQSENLVTDRQEEMLLAEDLQAITRTNHPLNLGVQHLQHQLANAIVLCLNLKMCNWKAEGQAFFGARSAFSQLSEKMEGVVDQLGDRLRMIGQDPQVGLGLILEGATVTQAEAGSEYRELLANADANAIIAIREIRDAIVALKRRDDDPGSIDLMVSILRMYEEHEWFFRRLLKPSGVTNHA